METQSTIVATLQALGAAVANAAVAFSVIGNTEATRIESIIVGGIALVYPLVNELRHHTNTHAATAAKQTAAAREAAFLQHSVAKTGVKPVTSKPSSK